MRVRIVLGPCKRALLGDNGALAHARAGAIVEFARPYRTLRIDKLAEAMHLILHKGTLVHGTVGKGEDPMALVLVGDKLTLRWAGTLSQPAGRCRACERTSYLAPLA